MKKERKRMNKLYQQLLLRRNELMNVREELLENNKRVPPGKLRISKRNSKCQYYQIFDAKDTNGKYINRKNDSLAKALAQKDYNNRLINEVDKELLQIETFLESYKPNKLEETYRNMNPYRKELVTPRFITDEDYLSNWVNGAHSENQFYQEEKRYQTKKGEYVRSKSEVLIANLYYEMEIPYKYECPVVLKDGKTKYPDFTILDVSRRRIIYHEHMGLIDNDEYRLTNLKKVMDYSKNGIFMGKNLIITFETKEYPLDMRTIRTMLTEILK